MPKRMVAPVVPPGAMAQVSQWQIIPEGLYPRNSVEGRTALVRWQVATGAAACGTGMEVISAESG